MANRTVKSEKLAQPIAGQYLIGVRRAIRQRSASGLRYGRMLLHDDVIAMRRVRAARAELLQTRAGNAYVPSCDTADAPFFTGRMPVRSYCAPLSNAKAVIRECTGGSQRGGATRRPRRPLPGRRSARGFRENNASQGVSPMTYVVLLEVVASARPWPSPHTCTIAPVFNSYECDRIRPRPKCQPVLRGAVRGAGWSGGTERHIHNAAV